MEDFRLGPIIARVEEGIPLEPRELRDLAARVARCPDSPDSLDWLLCLAHALINDDQPAAALGIFDRALRVKPGETLALLGRARALGALERYREAEADLRRIIERQPRHADALRALALLRLRGGAPGEARRLIELVLDTDPLDDYSRQILAEAQAATGDDSIDARPLEHPIGQPTLADFADELQTALTDRRLQSRIAGDSLIVAFGAGRRGRLSLSSLYAQRLADGRGTEAWTEEFVAGLGALRRPGPLDSVRGQLFPALRRPGFLERSGPALRADGPAGLVWLYAIDHADFVGYLPPDCLERWDLELPELQRIALENLERSPRAPSLFRIGRERLEPLPPGTGRWDVVAFDAGDGYDASRLLSPVHRGLLEAVERGPWAVALPGTSCALLARLHDDASIELLRALAAAEPSGGEEAGETLLRLDGARLEPFAG